MPETALERAEELAERLLPARTPKRRMLVIVNPYATTVSSRLKSLVVYALQSRYAVEAVDTEERNHATQLCREAAQEGYDVVVAFGGDGTVNEAANGLVGSSTPLTCLPGGSTNVWCRTLGIPNDVVDATEHLLRIADAFQPWRVDLGRLNERYFTFSGGVGLDASVVERVDSHPRLKARLGEYYYTYAAFSTFTRKYLLHAPHVRVVVDGSELEGVTVIAQNAEQYTYFGRRPIRLSPGVSLNDGSLGMVVLKRARPIELPTVGWRVFSGRPETVSRHRQIESLPGIRKALVTAIDGEALPVQVDGEFIGNWDRVVVTAVPDALSVVA